MALTELLKSPDAKATAEKMIAEPTFQRADSDTRFARLFVALSSKERAPKTFWFDPEKRPVIRIERGPAHTAFTIDEKLAPSFRSFLEGKLDELYKAFSAYGTEEASD